MYGMQTVQIFFEVTCLNNWQADEGKLNKTIEPEVELDSLLLPSEHPHQ